MSTELCSSCQFSETSCTAQICRLRLLDRSGKIIWTDNNIHPLPASELVGRYVWQIVEEVEELAMKRIIQRVLAEAKEAEFVRQDRFILAWWYIKIFPAMTVGSEIGAAMVTKRVCARLFELSQTQRIILEKMARGQTVETVARRLHISQNTVRTQIMRAKTKLTIDTTADLLLWAQYHRELLIHDLSRLQRQGSSSWVPNQS